MARVVYFVMVQPCSHVVDGFSNWIFLQTEISVLGDAEECYIMQKYRNFLYHRSTRSV